MNDEVPSSNQFSSLNPMETWIKALTQPKEEAYLAIVNDPGASLGKAVIWLAISGFVGGLISGIFSWIFGGSMYMDQFSQYFDFDMPMGGGGFMSVVSSPFSGLFGTLIGAFFMTGLVHLAARMLGGTGTFEKLFYGFAAYYAPLGLVTTSLSAIPFLGCLAVPLAIYGLVLNVIANKAVHGYDTGKAVIATLAPLLIIFLFCCCIIAIIGMLGGAILGPALNNVFGSF